MNKILVKTYSELQKFKTLEERFDYLAVGAKVGEDTLGCNRYLIQKFYKNSIKWKQARDEVILRDNACELGIDGNEINGPITVHHINPVTIQDILNDSYCLTDIENLISSSSNLHRAIHYGDKSILKNFSTVERSKNDQSPWKK